MRSDLQCGANCLISRLARALLALVVLACGPARAAVVFAPPEDSPDAASELKGIEREVSDKNFASAARRLDALLAARADHLVNVGEGTLTAVSAWADQLAPDQRAPLAAEYAKAFGAEAGRALDGLHKARDPGIDELYALARRYPMTAAAGAALGQAGDRALAFGDLAAGQAFYELASRRGFALDDVRAARLESVRRINAGVYDAPPADLVADGQGAATAAKPRAEGRLPYAGPLPFDATWFGDPDFKAMAKFFPVACGDRVLLASWNTVRMLRAGGGELLWAAANPQPPRRFPTLNPVPVGRGPLFAPAVLPDVHGRPMIVVVRQPGPEGGERHVLRGLGGADGRTLWSTATTDPRDEVSYAGLPAIAGRYVYGVAVRRTGTSTAELLLSALDVTSGAILWQTPLGALAEQGDGRLGGRKAIRSDPLDLDPFAELSEPAVAGDLVIVSPNCGATLAVGRFDGKIRWASVYRASDAPNARALRPPPLRWATERDAAAALRLRYRSTPVVCGDVVVAMPQDAPAIFAYDRAGGRRLWESDLLPAEAFGLAGASGDMAVLCGTSLIGLDAGGTGKRKWQYDPPRGTQLTGPAVVLGQTVIAPTSKGLIQLDVSTGKERQAYAVPDWRRLLESGGARPAVEEAGATRAFGIPDP